jgi:hypothetical protein
MSFIHFVTVLKFRGMRHNVLRVGDDALCCACGKAILLTRYYKMLFVIMNKTSHFFIEYCWFLTIW